MTGALSVPNFDRNQPYSQVRNNVMNYYSLVNKFFPRNGGRLNNTGYSSGYIYNLRSPPSEGTRSYSYAIPRS